MNKRISPFLLPFYLLYTLWAAWWFVSIFLVIFPFIFLFCQRISWKPYASTLVQWWSYLFFPLIGIRIKVNHRFRPDPKQVYVFCANHFSYFDIPVFVYLIKNTFSFLGKNAMAKIPLFGYMYTKLHILVDRSDKNSRAAALNKAIRALQKGRSIAIFPEGGMISKHPPYVHHPLKDGAVKMAISQQVPLVPVSMMNNYLIFNERYFLLRPGTIHVTIHPPLSTQGLEVSDSADLNERLHQQIQGALLAYHQLPTP